jgi:NDP-sugar pyrophosphorylase family protein
MQVLILAGGLGKRLRSVVDDRPKPMALVNNKPFLEYQLEFLRVFGLRQVVFCLGYLHEQIEAYFGDGSKFDMKIDYSIEEEQLGTGGALKHAEKYIQRTFVTLNGDTFFKADLSELLRFHRQHLQSALNGTYQGTIALTNVEDSRNYGAASLAEGGKITGFVEKEDTRQVSQHGSLLVNAGIYVLEPSILDLIPVNGPVSIEKEIFPSLLSRGYWLGGQELPGFFVDIGTPEGLKIFREYQKERSL